MGESVNLNTATTKPTYRIALVDGWQTLREDIDDDGVKDVSHGELARKFLADNDRAHYEVIPCDMEKREVSIIFNELAGDKTIDAVHVNFTFGRDNYEDTRRLLSEKYPERDFSGLNSQTLSQYKEEILGLMADKEERPAFEKLIKSGKKIFVSAGNKANDFNSYALFDDVITIGADKKYNGYADYKEIDERTKVRFNVYTKYDSDYNIAGYDVNEDGKIDFLPSELSGGESRGFMVIEGTSLGGPKWVSEHLPDILPKKPPVQQTK